MNDPRPSRHDDLPLAAWSSRLRRHLAHTLALILVLGSFTACSTGAPACSTGFEPYKGKCLTKTLILFLECTDGRGEDFSQEFGAGVTLPEAAGTTINAAYKRSRDENDAVALKIVDTCLELAESGANSTVERNAAKEFRQQTGTMIIAADKRIPAVSLVPDSLDCGSANVGFTATCSDVQVRSTGWSPLRISSIDKTGPGSADFDVVGDECQNETLTPPEGNCMLSVRFRPSASGERRATLIIHQNIPQPDRGTRLQLLGTGGAGGPTGTHTLSVIVDGAAQAVQVASNPPGIACPGSCTGSFSEGTEVALQATLPQAGGQLGWTGCDSADGAKCLVRLDANRSVTARLGPS